MSGIIDEYGQWERCNICGEFVLIQTLLYEEPSALYRYGRDVCKKCDAELGRAHRATIHQLDK